MAPRRSAAMTASEAITSALTPVVPFSSSPAPDVVTSSPAPTKGKPGRKPKCDRYADLVDAPLSPIVAKLRQMWRFAAVCQFMFTFDEAFGVSGFETEALEKDLDGSETEVIPDLVRRLLYTLTLNRDIDHSNWEHHLRVQCLARVPDRNCFGTHQDPIPFGALSLTNKIRALHDLCEWQLVDAERFRKLVKNDDEPEVWRIEPIGWDGAENTYWLYDDNRLWVQHAPPAPPAPPAKPRPPPKKGSKRARAEARAKSLAKSKPGSSSSRSRRTVPNASSSSRSLRGTEPRGVKRARESDAASASSSTPAKRTRSSFAPPPPAPAVRSTRRRGRGSAVDEDGWEEIPPELLTPSRKTQREDEEQEEADSDLSEPPEMLEQQDSEDDYEPEDAEPGEQEEDIDDEEEAEQQQEQEDVEAEEVEEQEEQENDQEPELEATDTEAQEADDVVKDDEDDVMKDGTAGHEATTPAELVSPSAEAAATPTKGTEDASKAFTVDEKSSVESETSTPPHTGQAEAELAGDEEQAEAKPKLEEEGDWVEFETVAVTRLEWMAMSTRFAKSRHPDERALHKFITSTILPRVLLDFDELDKQRRIEAAMAMRKRSSRIALKESEREERERDRIARLAMEERMSKLRNEEATKEQRERETADLLKSREDRMREREERVLAREQEAIDKAIAEQNAKDRREKNRKERAHKRDVIIANGGIPPHEDPRDALSDGDDDDNWELNCEVCGKAGVNLPDTQQIVCCELCGIWQHTKCWDTWDRSVHAPKRNWNRTDFYCGRCRPVPEEQPWPGRAPLPGHEVKPNSKARARAHDKPTDQQAQNKALPRSRSRAKQSQESDAASAAQTARDTEAAELLAGLAQVASMQLQQPVRPAPYVSPPLSSPHPSSASPMHYPPEHGYPNYAQTARSPGMPNYPQPALSYAPVGGAPQQQQHQHPHPQLASRSHFVQNAPALAARPLAASAPFGAQNRSPSQMANGAALHPVPQQALPSERQQQQQAAPAQQRPQVLAQAASPQAQLMQARLPGSMLPPSPSTPGTFNGERKASSTTGTSLVATTSPATSALAPAKAPTQSATLSPKAMSVPRRISSQPSGSFPLRHTVMRSPLSGASGGSPVPGMNLGPALAPRAVSPSPRSAQQQRTHNDALYQRQAALPSSPSLQLGPGPASGSLKERRPSTSTSGAGAPLARVPSVGSMHEFGPSPPKTAFGSGASTMAQVTPGTSIMGSQGPGLTATPAVTTTNGQSVHAALVSAPVLQTPAATNVAQAIDAGAQVFASAPLSLKGASETPVPSAAALAINATPAPPTAPLSLPHSQPQTHLQEQQPQPPTSATQRHKNDDTLMAPPPAS